MKKLKLEIIIIVLVCVIIILGYVNTQYKQELKSCEEWNSIETRWSSSNALPVAIKIDTISIDSARILYD